MAGLKKTPDEDPGKKRATKPRGETTTGRRIRIRKEATSEPGRTDPAGSRKPEGSRDLVTTDLGGLGPKLSDPDAPWTWHYRITRQSSQVASGFSNATTYPDARKAALGTLRDYLEAAKVPVGVRRIYACSVVQIGDDENIGAASGKDVR